MSQNDVYHWIMTQISYGNFKYFAVILVSHSFVFCLSICPSPLHSPYPPLCCLSWPLQRVFLHFCNVFTRDIEDLGHKTNQNGKIVRRSRFYTIELVV